MKSTKVPRRFSRSIEESDIGIPVLQPKYLSVDQVRVLYGLTRGVLYPLLREGRIQSVCIVGRDRDGEPRSRGKRLVSVASLEAYLSRLTGGQTEGVGA
jgi:hypothetical protein